MLKLSLKHIVYVESSDLRLSYVLKMWNDLLRDCQTLLRNWVVIKVVFGFVWKHAVRHSQSRWNIVPLRGREISLGNSIDYIIKCMAVLGLRVNL